MKEFAPPRGGFRSTYPACATRVKNGMARSELAPAWLGRVRQLELDGCDSEKTNDGRLRCSNCPVWVQKRRFEAPPIASGLAQSTDIARPARLVRFVAKNRLRGLRLSIVCYGSGQIRELGREKLELQRGPYMQPVTQYAKSGDVHIAYQAFGEGRINLVMVPGFVSNVENYWDEPDFARFLTRLASYARVVTFDKLGTGMSDRATELPGLDQRMDDLRAVMDAAGMEQAALLGISEGAPLSILFAATYPDRCRGLVLYGSFSRFSYWFPTEEALAAFFGYVGQAWGTGGSVQKFAPSRANDAAFQRWSGTSSSRPSRQNQR
jgi:hypothetical protein